MILRKSRKRSLSRAPEVYKKRHNSTPSHYSTARSARTHYKNKNGEFSISLDKNTIPDRIREIDQQMKELFIIDTAIDEFSSSLKSSLLSVSNTKQQNSTGETFFTFWNSYVQSITSYLRQPTVSRSLNYVVFYFNKSKEIINSLFSYQNFKSASLESRVKAKIEKHQSDINGTLSNLQQLIDSALKNLKENSDNKNISSEIESQIISDLSNMTYPFDCFYHEIKSKYAVFLETVLPDKNSREVQISNLSKSIKNIVDCTFSASKLDDLKKRFIQNLNDSTDIFNQIFKRPTVKNFSSTEKITHNHRSRSFYPPESNKEVVSQKRNKTEVYFREAGKHTHHRNSVPQKHRSQSDESSSGIDSIITIDEPSESITDDIKIPQKVPINRVMMTLSKSKYDHLNRKYNNNGETQSPQHTQHSKSSPKQQNHQNNNNNTNNLNNSANNQVTLMTKQNSKRASSTTSQGSPSSCPTRIRPNSFINHNNSKAVNNNNNNINNSSKKNVQKNDIMSQIYLSHGKEAQLLAQIEQISQQNDQLRQKRDQLAEMLEKSRHDSKIDALNREIKILRDSLEQMKTENEKLSTSEHLPNQQLEIELIGEVQTLRELVDSIKETNGLLVDEIEPCQHINSGLVSPVDLDDSTVNFDNMRLKKVCDEMKEKLRKRMARLDEIRKQNKKSLMISEITSGQQLSNDEKIAVFNFFIMDSRLTKREIEKLEKRLERYQENMSASINRIQNKNNDELNQNLQISFSKDHNVPLRKIISRINQLEEKIANLRKNQNGVYDILVDQLFKVKSSCVEINRLDKEISQKIDKYIQIGEKVQIKRKNFDDYEILKEKSRDLKIRYSTIKSSITNQMTTSQRYNIELQMDDIQDLFTCVMMEIERIGNQMTASQEGLKECRKDRSRIRREMKKYMDQEYQVANDSLEAEKRVFSLETEISTLMNKDNSNLNRDKDDLYVSKIAEALAESAQTKEIINLINEQAKEFNLELEPNQVKTEKQRIEDLKETVEKLITNGGPKMRQKLRIYNLKKEIESYH